uniref:Uncharacterized protein n=1 Tax=Chromera velia CCMP2878 TaxID=1169474 RepID=A0A0G4HS69_9ALVE|eukprot:Cvel_8249.t1-p1 / transcript=Cvel_8249.t1 / gene=Cvel_8249 / organism=Chromera_velia_CCMP2878 / gene_product=hypothetical protein / transcript_product=hypothetical protein / location=Cvel_scaffold451:56222-59212(+) / protein_length=642 / sequence_SO=supercontig / SO=protein_coding / is_pseudo=false
MIIEDISDSETSSLKPPRLRPKPITEHKNNKRHDEQQKKDMESVRGHNTAPLSSPLTTSTHSSTSGAKSSSASSERRDSPAYDPHTEKEVKPTSRSNSLLSLVPFSDCHGGEAQSQPRQGTSKEGQSAATVPVEGVKDVPPGQSDAPEESFLSFPRATDEELAELEARVCSTKSFLTFVRGCGDDSIRLGTFLCSENFRILFGSGDSLGQRALILLVLIDGASRGNTKVIQTVGECLDLDLWQKTKFEWNSRDGEHLFVDSLAGLLLLEASDAGSIPVAEAVWEYVKGEFELCGHGSVKKKKDRDFKKLLHECGRGGAGEFRDVLMEDLRDLLKVKVRRAIDLSEERRRKWNKMDSFSFKLRRDLYQCPPVSASESASAQTEVNAQQTGKNEDKRKTEKDIMRDAVARKLLQGGLNIRHRLSGSSLSIGARSRPAFTGCPKVGKELHREEERRPKNMERPGTTVPRAQEEEGGKKATAGQRSVFFDTSPLSVANRTIYLKSRFLNLLRIMYHEEQESGAGEVGLRGYRMRCQTPAYFYSLGLKASPSELMKFLQENPQLEVHATFDRVGPSDAPFLRTVALLLGAVRGDNADLLETVLRESNIDLKILACWDLECFSGKRFTSPVMLGHALLEEPGCIGLQA